MKRSPATLAQTPISPLPEAESAPLAREIQQRLFAGFPAPAGDYRIDALDLNRYLIRNPQASFIFSVQGDSMIGAAIADGDKVIVDRSRSARHGDIVVAEVTGEYTIKRLFLRENRVELHPENPDYPPIRFGAGEELRIWGVVVGVVRRLGN